MAYENSLAFRLKNCLTTLFEMEEALAGSRGWLLMKNDFAMLRQAAQHLLRATNDGVELAEEDVQRIEEAAARFLKELEGNLGYLSPEKMQRVLQ